MDHIFLKRFFQTVLRSTRQIWSMLGTKVSGLSPCCVITIAYLLVSKATAWKTTQNGWVNFISATYIGNCHFHFRFYFETLENSRYRETEYSFIASQKAAGRSGFISSFYLGWLLDPSAFISASQVWFFLSSWQNSNLLTSSVGAWKIVSRKIPDPPIAWKETV